MIELFGHCQAINLIHGFQIYHYETYIQNRTAFSELLQASQSYGGEKTKTTEKY